MRYIIILSILTNFLLANKFYFEFGKKIEIQNKIIHKSLDNKTNIERYTTTKGKQINFRKNEIIVRCHDKKECKDDFLDLNLQNFKEISTSFYLIKLENKENIFDICKNLYEKKDIKLAHPNYLLNAGKR